MKTIIRKWIILITTILLFSSSANAFGSFADELVLLENNDNKLLFLNRNDGILTKTYNLPNPEDGPFTAIDIDNQGNVFILQEIVLTSEGRILFFNSIQKSFQTIANFTGHTSNWIDIEWIESNRVLLLNSCVDGSRDPSESSRLYVINDLDTSNSNNSIIELGTLIEPTEGNWASTVFKICYFENDQYSGVWCLEHDGSPIAGQENAHNVGAGEDIFFFQINNWLGSENNQVSTGSSKTDVGQLNEYHNRYYRTDVADFLLDKHGNIILLEQDNAVSETVKVGQTLSDDIFRLNVNYEQESITFGDEVLVAEWPSNYSASEGITEIRLMAMDKESGQFYGIDQNDVNSFSTIYSLDRTLTYEMTGYTSIVDINLISSSDYDYISLTGQSLTSDTTWSGNYLISGDIIVSSGTTLTISPGSRIAFVAKFDDQAGGNNTGLSELIVENGGILIINGSHDNQVILTSQQIPAAQGDWGGIRCAFSSASQFLSITNCTIEGAEYGLYYDQNGGFSSINFKNVRFNRCSETGLYINVHNAARINLHYSSIEGSSVFNKSHAVSNAKNGIYVSVKDIDSFLECLIDNVTFENNGESGIYLDGYNNTTMNYSIKNSHAFGHSNYYGIHSLVREHCVSIGYIEKNTASDNSVGIYSYNYYSYKNPKVFIHTNNTFNNISNAILYRHHRGYAATLSVKENHVRNTKTGPGISAYRESYSNSEILNITFENNLSYGNKLRGIECYRTSSAYYVQVTARNNTCYNNGSDGFYFDVTSSSEIESNYSYDNTNHGIVLHSQNTCKIESNELYKNGLDGLWISSAQPIDIWKNIIFENTGNGIYFQSGGQANCFLNEIKSNMKAGINFSNVKASYTFFNRVFDNSGDGLIINNSDLISLNFNNIYSNAKIEDPQTYEINEKSKKMTDARLNYFGTVENINDLIYDQQDNFSLGPVDIKGQQDTFIPTPSLPLSSARIINPIDQEEINNNITSMIQGIAVSENESYTIQVSIDNGETWNNIPGSYRWSYSWTTPESGNVVLKARILDNPEDTHVVNVTINEQAHTKSGFINSDETWSGEVHIEGDITVSSGVTLDIEAGTVVKFSPYDRIRSGDITLSEFFVDGGVLNIKGTENNPVTFTTSYSTPQKGLWGGIVVKQDSTASSPLNIKHTKIEYSTQGINYNLKDWDDPLCEKPVILEDVYVNQTSNRGIQMLFDGGQGCLAMQGIQSSYNDHDGIYAKFTNKSRWNTDFTNIYSHNNKQTGINFNPSGGSHVTLNITSDSEVGNQTITTLAHNTHSGMDILVNETNSSLTLTAEASVYTANSHGLYIDAQNSTFLSYTITNNIMAGHTSKNHIGVNILSREHCKSFGTIQNNLIYNNYFGIYTYPWYAYNTPTHIIKNNTLRDNISAGIYFYQYNGYGSQTIIRDNIITNTTSGSGIYCKRDYKQNSSPVEIEFINNKSYNNRYRGICVAGGYYLKLKANGNIVYDNNSEGISFLSSIYSEVWNNHVYSNKGYGIEIVSSADAKIYSNSVHENSKQGIRVTSAEPTIVYENQSYLNGDDGFWITSSGSPNVYSNITQNNDGNGIWLSCKNEMRVSNNFVKQNLKNGVYVTGEGNIRFYLNNCIDNKEDGIHLKTVGESDILYNTIQNNTGNGVYVSATDMIMLNSCNLINNYNPGESFDIYNASQYSVDASFNYFGEDNPSSEILWDQNDDSAIGTVNIDNWETTMIEFPKNSKALIKNPISNEQINNNAQIISGIAISESNPFTVEISTDNGITWNYAQGENHWFYEWQSPVEGLTTIQARIKSYTDSFDQVNVNVNPNLPTSSGTLTKNEIWDSSIAGNIVITGDVIVPEGITLTITEGTTIQFSVFDDIMGGSFPLLPELIVEGGTIIIQGTEEKPIRFTSQSNQPVKGLWGGIVIHQYEGNKKPLQMHHTIVEYAETGIEYTIDKWSDPQHLNPVIFNNVTINETNGDALILIFKDTGDGDINFQNVNIENHIKEGIKLNVEGEGEWNIACESVQISNVGNTGIGIDTNGMHGDIILSDVISQANAEHGIHVYLAGDNKWNASFEGVKCLNNGKQGLFVNPDKKTDLTLNMKAPPESNLISPNIFMKNKEHGVYCLIQGEATALSINACGGEYSGNKSGMVFDANNKTILYYIIEDNLFAEHINGNYGLYLLTRENCQSKGIIRNNTVIHNSYGIYRYSWYGYDYPISTIEHNNVTDSLTNGVIYRHHMGYGAYVSINNNNVTKTIGSGIRIYRENYQNSDILTIELSHNKSFDNTSRGIQVDRQSSAYYIKVIANDNLCYNNGHDGLYLDTTAESTVNNNLLYQNKQSGLVFYCQAKSEVFSNICYSNSKYGFHLPSNYFVTFNGNQSYDNGLDGLYLYARNNTLIYGNRLVQNKGDGLELHSDAIMVNVLFNEISENTQHGIRSSCALMPNINYNNIYNNNIGENQYLISNQHAKHIDARYTYMGQDIDPDLLIYDKNDNTSKGTVNYQPLLSEPVDITIVTEKVMIKDPKEDQNEIIPVSPYIIRGIAICRSGIKRVEIQVEDGGEWYPAIGTNDWQYEWNIQRPGDYTLKARIIDNTNQILLNSNQVEFQVSSTIPTTSGILTKDEIWSDEHSPIIITGDVTVPKGIVLTIQPGVKVLFSSNDDRQSGNVDQCEILIDEGSLIIEGTESDPVLFSVAGEITTRGLWSGIVIKQAGEGILNIKHCNIEYGNKGISFVRNGGIGEFVIENVSIKESKEDALYLELENVDGSVALNDLIIKNNTKRGLVNIFKGGQGSVNINRVISEYNGSTGVESQVSSNGNWNIGLTDIVSSSNAGGGAWYLFGIIFRKLCGLYCYFFIRKLYLLKNNYK
jgi:parallel beta-helix repeat protein